MLFTIFHLSFLKKISKIFPGMLYFRGILYKLYRLYSIHYTYIKSTQVLWWRSNTRPVLQGRRAHFVRRSSLFSKYLKLLITMWNWKDGYLQQELWFTKDSHFDHKCQDFFPKICLLQSFLVCTIFINYNKNEY